jgi:hypothetical protein
MKNFKFNDISETTKSVCQTNRRKHSSATHTTNIVEVLASYARKPQKSCFQEILTSIILHVSLHGLIHSAIQQRHYLAARERFKT